MSDIKLTCEETPLTWPPSVEISDIPVCNSCGIKIDTPYPGTLKILTRRQGAGVGDGVNIEESNTISADYRGQIYSLDEAIFHTPGLHIFPGQKDFYPAEYHIHMSTSSTQKPQRAITIVIPVSHMVNDVSSQSNYFASMSKTIDPTAKRPTLTTLFRGAINMIQYEGPDIRGRTSSITPAGRCKSTDERQFLLVLTIASIRATDLERIPNEGSLSRDPRDLPAPGVRSTKAVARDRLLRTTVLASPGIIQPLTAAKARAIEVSKELECKPVNVVNGRDVIDVAGKSVDVYKLLGISGESAESRGSNINLMYIFYILRFIVLICFIAGFSFAHWVMGFIWIIFFVNTPRLDKPEPLFVWFMVFMAVFASVYIEPILWLFGVSMP
jgi:hypothetical protein